MEYDAQKMLSQFNEAMVDIRKAVPKEYEAFMKEKEVILASGKVPEKTKWLLLLVASTTQKCPVCIPRAVRHCLDAGWTKEEMLETAKSLKESLDSVVPDKPRIPGRNGKADLTVDELIRSVSKK